MGIPPWKVTHGASLLSPRSVLFLPLENSLTKNVEFLPTASVGATRRAEHHGQALTGTLRSPVEWLCSLKQETDSLWGPSEGQPPSGLLMPEPCSLGWAWAHYSPRLFLQHTLECPGYLQVPGLSEGSLFFSGETQA